ncbi:RUN and FYVE domain-containing protein 2-like isoform X1 [Eriocheir sinensis]|uniref:RUN and FYVE domain-containing protein 2-like isoform X1 n=1 Tax=Eriocheir sinensis TaxID=95602 RepID=UPI0021C81123|nr:RUN and FYVE domain-containing protein 2-like isoform X1 [Eriocheir sinensis]XP_050688552.1 RUN and FYVE domain-containing protein 2-like isoform X1 [Eriocheir sinensis]XP_050688553.1 RUN and FYVE domain-containing protein 2-like isoform X1 [Eriocheir sinensis]XP_050688554.1 RUN and FYVE domain-containing protein 2-like isoform X1 [Eriocheir sinensis]
MVLVEMAGAEDTIYLCNFRVSVDGDWLCLKELAEGGNSSTGVAKDSSASSSPGSPPPSERDPVCIERSNLVNICKLVVKELIESSLKFGRQLDSDSVPLQHFFIVLEHVLRHGLKPKRGLLGPKKELWDLFQLVEKWSYEAQDITASVRDLPTVKTHIGRARAWLRLALMQKKLADYFRLLIERRDELLTEFYETGALMLADEAIVIMGLLVGLNVIDCNLCVKEEDLDSQMGVIDFSLYLRNTGADPSPDDNLEQTDMTTVLDQKNYIEELNRHLNATVTNLQAKMETLITTNALMKEDLSIAKNTILHMQEDNDRLRKDKGLPTQQQQEQLEKEAQKANRVSVIGCEEEMQDLKLQLEEESAHRKQVEKELELQIQMKAESEMAAKLLEKDIHEKQDTIISLRQQLDEIKVINLEMYRKLQECESSLKQKTELIGRLEAKAAEMAETIRNLESQYEECLLQKEAAKTTAQKLSDKVCDGEVQSSTLETDLKIEREWRQSLQETLVKDREAKAELQQQVKELGKQREEYLVLKAAHMQLISTVENQERTLEELGAHLSESKLKMADLRDVSKSLRDAQWAPDKEANKCRLCEKEFSIARRRHHCRHCGNIFCHSCSDNTMPLPSSARPVRVCDACHTQLLERYSNSEN